MHSPSTSKNFSHLGNFRNNEEAEMAVREWLRMREPFSTAMDFFCHLPKWDKYINMLGDYFRK
jgi:hypothetical protein